MLYNQRRATEKMEKSLLSSPHHESYSGNCNNNRDRSVTASNGTELAYLKSNINKRTWQFILEIFFQQRIHCEELE